MNVKRNCLLQKYWVFRSTSSLVSKGNYREVSVAKKVKVFYTAFRASQFQSRSNRDKLYQKRKGSCADFGNFWKVFAQYKIPNKVPRVRLSTKTLGHGPSARLTGKRCFSSYLIRTTRRMS